MVTDTAASISELKANPMKVVASGHGMPVVVLNCNQPAFYCVPADAYEAMMEMLDDLELLKLVRQRQGEKTIKVTLDDLLTRFSRVSIQRMEKLGHTVREQFKKKLEERLQNPHVPNSAVSGAKNVHKIKLRQAGY